MKIQFKEEDNTVSYVVSEYPKEYKPILESQYYTPVNGAYVKKFPNNLDNLKKAEANFVKYADDMFAQMGYFKEIHWESALLSFIEKARYHEIDWWLTGSCALCVRGINVMPHDIDIILDSHDIQKINEMFSDYIVEPINSTKGWVTDYFGVLFMDARIDLAFDPQEFADHPEPCDFGLYAKSNLQNVLWKGNTIKVPPLELQLQVNHRRGRHDRVRAIKEFIKTHDS
jgi:hypothetical protein